MHKVVLTRLLPRISSTSNTYPAYFWTSISSSSLSSPSSSSLPSSSWLSKHQPDWSRVGRVAKSESDQNFLHHSFVVSVDIQPCNQVNPYFSVDKSSPKDFFGARLVCQRTILAHQFLSCHIPRVVIMMMVVVMIMMMMTMMMPMMMMMTLMMIHCLRLRL